MSANATIYAADPSLIGTKMFGMLEGIQKYEGLSEGGEGNRATGLRFELDAGRITMNFMPPKMIEEQVQGLAAYVQHVLKEKDRLPYILSRIHHVRFVIGCVIEPGFDEGGKIQQFLFHFSGILNGLLFADDTLFDYDGEPLAGPLAEKGS